MAIVRLRRRRLGVLTRNALRRHELGCIFLDPLCLILAGIAAYCYDARAVLSDCLEDLEPRGYVHPLGARQHNADGGAILDALRSALSLICCGSPSASYTLHERAKNIIRGSIGWAASPTSTMRPLLQAGMGARYRSAHCLTSVAFLDLHGSLAYASENAGCLYNVL